jgi:hypothetical protein
LYDNGAADRRVSALILSDDFRMQLLELGVD